LISLLIIATSFVFSLYLKLPYRSGIVNKKVATYVVLFDF
jgi:hypothetical protein